MNFLIFIETVVVFPPDAIFKNNVKKAFIDNGGADVSSVKKERKTCENVWIFNCNLVLISVLYLEAIIKQQVEESLLLTPSKAPEALLM